LPLQGVAAQLPQRSSFWRAFFSQHCPRVACANPILPAGPERRISFWWPSFTLLRPAHLSAVQYRARRWRLYVSDVFTLYVLHAHAHHVFT